jgi:hypothetical protein
VGFVFLLNTSQLSDLLTSSAEITAKWCTSIKFQSDPCSGLKVVVQPSAIVPKIEVSKTHGDLNHGFHLKMLEQLKEQLPSSVEFGQIVGSLKSAFEGCWSGLYMYSRELHVVNPVFNRHGDFLLDLTVLTTGVAQTPSRKPSSIGVNGGFRDGAFTTTPNHSVM